jgi:hypothetical protein
MLLLAVCAQATELIDTTVSSNPGINNSSISLNGQLFLDDLSPTAICLQDPEDDDCVTLPWIVNVFAHGGECLRLDVTRPVQNEETLTTLGIMVIDPFGGVYRNTRRSSSDFRPLVKINTLGDPGWYAVVVQRTFDETGPARFTLRYGRYNAGNPNCANPTQPLVSEQGAAMGLTGEQEAAAREAMHEQRKAIRTAE